MTRIYIGMVSSCASPMACLRQPQTQVSSCLGSSWMTSMRGRSAGSGLRLPRCLAEAATSSAFTCASSISCSASLKSAIWEVAGSIKRLSQRQKPLRSQCNSFTRLRGLLRKTNSTALNTANLMPGSTRAAKPSMEF